VSVLFLCTVFSQFLYLCSLSPTNISDDSTGDSYFDVVVNDTNPIWYYCSQNSHCVEGMVGSVNAAPVGNTFDAYKQLAMASNIISPVIPAVAGGWVIKKSASYQYGYNNSTPGYNAGTPGYNTSTPASYNSGYSQADVAGASTTAQKVKTIAKGALIAIVVGAVSLLLLSVLLVYCCCCRRRNSRAAPERGDGGFMGYGASSYRPINSPAPGVSVGKNADYEPLVAPGEKIHAPNDDYHPSVAYDPPQPTSLGQYSTAWDQHK
jgi:hypothetical protein